VLGWTPDPQLREALSCCAARKEACIPREEGSVPPSSPAKGVPGATCRDLGQRSHLPSRTERWMNPRCWSAVVELPGEGKSGTSY